METNMSANNTPLTEEDAASSQLDQETRKAKIRSLNDTLRKHATGGIYLLSRGVAAQDEFTRIQVLLEIALETSFDEQNDPFNEHDFGKVEYEEIKYFWKIEYYDHDLQFASKDPSNPNITTRVMTIMLAEEY